MPLGKKVVRKNQKKHGRKPLKPNKEEAIKSIEHWYNCKVDIDEGSSKEEHKIYMWVKSLIQRSGY